MQITVSELLLLVSLFRNVEDEKIREQLDKLKTSSDALLAAETAAKPNP